MDTQNFIESRVIVDRRDLNVFGQTISSSPLHGGWGGGECSQVTLYKKRRQIDMWLLVNN